MAAKITREQADKIEETNRANLFHKMKERKPLTAFDLKILKEQTEKDESATVEKPRKAVANKEGRPTRYKAEYCELARELALLGATDIEMAKSLGVCHRTFNVWKKSHPEFMHSLSEGKDLADAKVAKSLYERANGYTCKETKIAMNEGKITDSEVYDKNYPPDVSAAIFWLKNRQRGKWNDRTEVAHTGDVVFVLGGDEEGNE